MKAEKSTTVTTDPYEVERIDENIGHCYCRRLEAATSPKLNFKSKATRRVVCPIPGIFGGTRDPSIGILNADSSPFTGQFSGRWPGHEIARSTSRPTDANRQHPGNSTKLMGSLAKLTILAVEIAVRPCTICMGKKRKGLAFCAAQSHIVAVR
jgi:hypothetical protein